MYVHYTRVSRIQIRAKIIDWLKNNYELNLEPLLSFWCENSLKYHALLFHIDKPKMLNYNLVGENLLTLTEVFNIDMHKSTVTV